MPLYTYIVPFFLVFCKRFCLDFGLFMRFSKLFTLGFLVQLFECNFLQEVSDGANWTFILWGLLHGLFSCFDRMFEKTEEKVFMPIRWLCTFVVVSILWLLFSAQSVEQWTTILYKILLMQNTAVSDGMIASFNLVENQFVYNMLNLHFLSENVRGFNMLVFILVGCIVCFVPENNFRKKDSLNIGSLLLASFAFIWGILCLGAESTFVYFGF